MTAVPMTLPNVIWRLRQNGRASSTATMGGAVAMIEIQYQLSPFTAASRTAL